MDLCLGVGMARYLECGSPSIESARSKKSALPTFICEARRAVLKKLEVIQSLLLYYY